MSDTGQERDRAMLRQQGLLNDGGPTMYPHFRPIGPIMRPGHRRLGPALPFSILLAISGVVLMLLAMITMNRFVFATFLLSAGFLLGNALAMFLMWWWQGVFS